MIYPFIMAGGTGKRLWPLSKGSRPKQFLPLLGDHSLLQDTYQRLQHKGYASAAVIANEAHRFLVAQHLHDMGAQGGEIILEAHPRSTAFTVAIAALSARDKDPDALILLMPCDTYIEDTQRLHGAVEEAEKHARNGKLVIFGVPPTAPKTGYGYIHHDGQGAVLNFTEKPDAHTAAGYIEQGDYLWNAGMFLFSAAQIIEELAQHAPQVLEAAQESWAGMAPDLDFLRLPQEGAEDCPTISIDHAVLEKTHNAHVIALNTGWNEIGSWQSLWAQLDKDENGNAARGDTALRETTNSLLYGAQGMSVAALGVEGLAIIASEDAVLVADLNSAEHVASIAQKMEESAAAPSQVWRPWGNYKILSCSDRYVVKRLTINPGASLSLQYHNHRAEHWVVVKGTIKVQKGKDLHVLTSGQSLYIPIVMHHRIENESAEIAEVIEVQTGDYLAEDDIVRLKGGNTVKSA
jgi:mannose-1-phosphate guanylyltransferase/mannose-6-phosphate isomerase